MPISVRGAGTGDGKDADHQYQPLYLGRVVEAREGLGRLFDAKEPARTDSRVLQVSSVMRIRAPLRRQRP
jgi:hypothetical protein